VQEPQVLVAVERLEIPGERRGQRFPIRDGTSTMGGTEARVAGGTAKGITGFFNYPINMVTPLASGGFISLDTVSPLSRKTFTAWDRAGQVNGRPGTAAQAWAGTSSVHRQKGWPAGSA
jgi:hypothetical protein